jgi:hypothetical protein
MPNHLSIGFQVRVLTYFIIVPEGILELHKHFEQKKPTVETAGANDCLLYE